MSGLLLAPAAWYHLAVLGYVLILTTTAAVNFACFRRPRARAADPQTAPRVSVLVPARNEEANIEACIRSLRAMPYPHLEIVALDDHSTDKTGDILHALAQTDPRLRVLDGADLPPGWRGKTWACWQMAQAAQGEFLLLTDADCLFAGDAVEQAFAAMSDADADVVSLVPRLDAVGFWEKLIIPLQYFIIFAFLPTPLVRRMPFPSLAAANGAFLFLRRDVYFDLDGHRAVRSELAEDVAFARHVKRSGRTLWYGDGSGTYSVRMYDGFGGLWEGFSRSLFAAFGSSAALVGVMVVLIACAFVLPPFFALWGFLAHTAWWPLPALSWGLMATVRAGLTMRFRRDSLPYALLNPLAWSIVCAIAVNSARRALTGAGTAWKGRVYGRV